MTQPNLLELAKQGDARAIASLINRQLQPKGITAKAALKDGCLQIMLESAQVPGKEALVPFIRNGVTKLEIASLKQVKVYGRQKGEEFPAWNHELKLPETQNPFQNLEINTEGYLSSNSSREITKPDIEQRSTGAKIKKLGFMERISTATFSFIFLLIVGIVLLFIPIIGWFLGPVCLLGAVVLPLGFLIGDPNYVTSLVGKCPYCNSEITTSVDSKKADCSYCKKSIVIRNQRFYTIKD